MADLIGNLQQRAPRYRVSRDVEIVVTITRQDESCYPLEAKLIDISVGGTKLKTPAPLAIDEVATVEIRVPHLEQAILVLAEVCWVAPTAGGSWWLGCSLNPPIPAARLDEFATAGILERRQHQRQCICLPATARWELADRSAAGRVVNCSPGGFCLHSDAAAKLGSRVLLHLRHTDDEQALVRGKAIWQFASSEGYVIGCEFVRAGDYSILKEMHTTQQCAASGRPVLSRLRKPRVSTVPGGRSRRRTAMWSALVATLLAVCLWSGPQLSRMGRTITMAGPSTLAPEAEAAAFERSAALPGGQPGYSTSGDRAPAAADAPFRPITAWPGHTPAPPQLAVLTRLDGNARTETEPRRPVLARASRVPDGGPRSSACPPRERLLQLAERERAAGWTTGETRQLRSLATQSVHGTARAALPKRRREQDSLIDTVAVLPPHPHAPDAEQAREFMRLGRDHYSRGQFSQAAVALQTAIRHDATNAELHYLLAIVQYRQQLLDRAERTVRRAVELEAARPVEPWGKKMERYQGAVRLWLEQTRRRSRGS